MVSGNIKYGELQSPAWSFKSDSQNVTHFQKLFVEKVRERHKEAEKQVREKQKRQRIK